MSFKFSKASLRNREGVDPRLIEISDLALTLSPIDFGIPKYGGLRTKDDQYALYCDGKSRCDGTKVLSKHQSGKALDVYAFVDGKASWDKGHLTLIALAMFQAAQQLGYHIKWGGFWRSFLDYPHFELAD